MPLEANGTRVGIDHILCIPADSIAATDEKKRLHYECFVNAAFVSQAAYSEDPHAELVQNVANAKGRVRHSIVEIWPSISRQWLIAIDSNGILYVSFRGTTAQDWKDILTDLNVVPLETTLGGQMHRGFLDRSRTCFKDNLITSIYWAKDCKGLVLTGHSLGGAVATAAGIEFLGKFGNALLTDLFGRGHGDGAQHADNAADHIAFAVITFGAPPVADDALARQLSRLRHDRYFHNVTHQGDVIPLGAAAIFNYAAGRAQDALNRVTEVVDMIITVVTGNNVDISGIINRGLAVLRQIVGNLMPVYCAFGIPYVITNANGMITVSVPKTPGQAAALCWSLTIQDLAEATPNNVTNAHSIRWHRDGLYTDSVLDLGWGAARQHVKGLRLTVPTLADRRLLYVDPRNAIRAIKSLRFTTLSISIDSNVDWFLQSIESISIGGDAVGGEDNAGPVAVVQGFHGGGSATATIEFSEFARIADRSEAIRNGAVNVRTVFGTHHVDDARYVYVGSSKTASYGFRRLFNVATMLLLLDDDHAGTQEIQSIMQQLVAIAAFKPDSTPLGRNFENFGGSAAQAAVAKYMGRLAPFFAPRSAFANLLIHNLSAPPPFPPGIAADASRLWHMVATTVVLCEALKHSDAQNMPADAHAFALQGRNSLLELGQIVAAFHDQYTAALARDADAVAQDLADRSFEAPRELCKALVNMLTPETVVALSLYTPQEIYVRPEGWQAFARGAKKVLATAGLGLASIVPVAVGTALGIAAVALTLAAGVVVGVPIGVYAAFWGMELENDEEARDRLAENIRSAANNGFGESLNPLPNYYLPIVTPSVPSFSEDCHKLRLMTLFKTMQLRAPPSAMDAEDSIFAQMSRLRLDPCAASFQDHLKAAQAPQPGDTNLQAESRQALGRLFHFTQSLYNPQQYLDWFQALCILGKLRAKVSECYVVGTEGGIRVGKSTLLNKVFDADVPYGPAVDQFTTSLRLVRTGHGGIRVLDAPGLDEADNSVRMLSKSARDLVDMSLVVLDSTYAHAANDTMTAVARNIADLINRQLPVLVLFNKADLLAQSFRPGRRAQANPEELRQLRLRAHSQFSARLTLIRQTWERLIRMELNGLERVISVQETPLGGGLVQAEYFQARIIDILQPCCLEDDDDLQGNDDRMVFTRECFESVNGTDNAVWSVETIRRWVREHVPLRIAQRW